MHSDDNINAVVWQYKMSGMHFERRETFFFMLPPFLGFGMTMLHLAICTGIETNLFLQHEQKKIVEGFSHYKPNHFVTGPVYVDAIMEKLDIDLGFLIDFSGGGETLAVEKERKINDYLRTHNSVAKYTQGYGMTETAATVITNQMTVRKEGSMGIPLPKVNLKVIDVNTKKELPIGEEGELLVQSPSIFIGYYKQGRETSDIREVIENESWLHTGDLVRIDADGFVYMQGRIKRIYVAKDKKGYTYKLFPQRIEELFIMHSKVDNCATVVREDPKYLYIPIVFVTLQDGASKEQIIDELKSLAKEELPEQMQPDDIIILDVIPLTPSGKIDYRKLEEKVSRNETGNGLQTIY